MDKQNNNSEDQLNKDNNQGSNTVKDPAEWKTGDEPMTGAQKSYLHTLSTQTGEDVDENLSKAEASKRIEELKENQHNDDPDGNSNMRKDPDDWKTGGERMTGAQRSYLKTLSDEANEEFDENLTKAEAAKRIDELQRKTGRGMDGDPQPS